MVTPEEARQFADVIDDYPIGRNDKYIAEALRDLASQVERLEAQRKQLREALTLFVSPFDGDIISDIENLYGTQTRIRVCSGRTALKDTE